VLEQIQEKKLNTPIVEKLSISDSFYTPLNELGHLIQLDILIQEYKTD
jgi:hypothetical protein